MIASLAARPYSVHEMRKKLYSKKIYPREEIEHAVSEGIRLRFLNDETYAEDAVASLKNRGYGTRKIDMKLKEKGIAKELAAKSIAEDDGLEGRDPLSMAKEVLRRRLRSLNAVADINKRREKALRLLAGRGFDSASTFTAVKIFMNGGLEEDGENEYE